MRSRREARSIASRTHSPSEDNKVSRNEEVTKKPQEDESFRTVAPIYSFGKHYNSVTTLRISNYCVIILLNITVFIFSTMLMICYALAYYWIDSFNAPLPGQSPTREYILISAILITITSALALLSFGTGVTLICNWMRINTKILLWLVLLFVTLSLVGLLTLLGIGVFKYFDYDVWRLLPMLIPGILVLTSYCIISFVILYSMSFKKTVP